LYRRHAQLLRLRLQALAYARGLLREELELLSVRARLVVCRQFSQRLAFWLHNAASA
jgi:hypothetical protein